MGNRRGNVAGDIDKPERVVGSGKSGLPKVHAERRDGMDLRQDAQIACRAERNSQFRGDFWVQSHDQPKSRSAASMT